MVRLKVAKIFFLSFIYTPFQFLMVRLKADTKIYSIISNTTISIPYGAIKRIQHFFRKTKSKKFQFLMVRLKVYKKIFYLIIKF